VAGYCSQFLISSCNALGLPSGVRAIFGDYRLTRDDVIARLVPVMEDVFDEDDLIYDDGLTAGDVPGWDSLSHIRFMVAIERAFSVRFSAGEIEGFKNVGDLVEAIQNKSGR